ncbi:MAG: hypothetical protein RPV21_01345 [Candidatus Sedimenticola sp. (ex Thyasira tokunagai)]
MKEMLKPFLSRVPWRFLIVLLGGALVVKGGEQLLSVELPAGSDTVMQLAKQGMGMVVAGGVTLIAAIIVR